MTDAAASVGPVSDEADRQLELDAIEEPEIASLLSDNQAPTIADIESPRPGEGCQTTGWVRILPRLSGSGPSDPSRLIADAED